jgi:quercetin dioxygenase-like cupin family protein
MASGVHRQSLAYGERTHLVRFRLEKGAEIPVHEHPHEQTGYLLEGSMVMTIRGRRYALEPGDSWSLRGGVPHGVEVLEECLVFEVFAPVRKDYLG